MRLPVTLLLVLLAGTANVAFADNWMSTDAVRDGEKDRHGGGTPFDGGKVEGDDVASAFPIPGLPFSETGNTCGYANDYDWPCPYGGNAPDLVYSFVPDADMEITIDLCNSWYDTKLIVFEDQEWNVHACNDDGCSGPNYPYPYVSVIDCMHVTAGHTYYIVVTGYGTECGDYQMNVTMCDPCTMTFPPGAQVEKEGECEDNYVDHANGGCGSIPPVFEAISCSGDPFYLQGTSGTYSLYGNEVRDTDWYELRLDSPTELNLSLHACFPHQLKAIRALSDCYHYETVYTANGDYQNDAGFGGTFDAGRWWIWIGPSIFTGVPCGAEYLLTIEGLCPATATDASSWGSVKELFR